MVRIMENKFDEAFDNERDDDLEEFSDNRAFLARLVKAFLATWLFGLPLVLGLFLLYRLFYSVQKNTFLPQNGIMLIEYGPIRYTFIAFGAAILLLIIAKVFNYKMFLYTIGKYASIRVMAIVVVTAFMIATYLQFIWYTAICTDGIIDHRNIFHKEVYYSWKDVKKAEVIHTFHDNKYSNIYSIHYVITTSDNRQFDLKLSKEFWDKVIDVDTILKKENVKIKTTGCNSDISASIVIGEPVDYIEGQRIIDQIMPIIDKPDYLTP